MKEDSLQHLLARYQQGTISKDELEQLNVLTRRDEVMETASHKAGIIVRRRRLRTASYVMAGMAVVGVGIGLLLPREDTQIVAEVKTPPQVIEEQVGMIEQETPQKKNVVQIAMGREVAVNTIKVESHAIPSEADVEVEEINIVTKEEPTVICNNHCDADSVISDIWRFLTA